MLKYKFKNVSNCKEIAKNRNLILRKIEDLSKIQCRIMERYPQRIKRNLQQRTQLEQKSEMIHFKNAFRKFPRLLKRIATITYSQGRKSVNVPLDYLSSSSQHATISRNSGKGKFGRGGKSIAENLEKLRH